MADAATPTPIGDGVDCALGASFAANMGWGSIPPPPQVIVTDCRFVVLAKVED